MLYARRDGGLFRTDLKIGDVGDDDVLKDAVVKGVVVVVVRPAIMCLDDVLATCRQSRRCMVGIAIFYI